MSDISEKVRAEFGTRPSSYREKVLLQLYAKKGKAIKLSEVAKKVYGTPKDRMKVKATIVGLNMMIDDLRLPYSHVEFAGRGEDTTLALVAKAKRAKAKASSSKKR